MELMLREHQMQVIEALRELHLDPGRRDPIGFVNLPGDKQQ